MTFFFYFFPIIFGIVFFGSPDFVTITRAPIKEQPSPDATVSYSENSAEIVVGRTNSGITRRLRLISKYVTVGDALGSREKLNA